MPANHALGRIMPTGEGYERWRCLTRLGKNAWYWNALYMYIKEEIDELPTTSYRIIKLEQFDYNQYLDLADLCDLGNPLSRTQFDKVTTRRPGRNKKPRDVESWSSQEKHEYLVETKPAREAFNIQGSVPEC